MIPFNIVRLAQEAEEKRKEIVPMFEMAVPECADMRPPREKLARKTNEEYQVACRALIDAVLAETEKKDGAKL